jgi:Cu(I)/Ag(I) efflux system membrane protein CusA/SilA
MIDRIISWSIRRRGSVIAASLVLAVSCVVAFSRAPIDAIPDLSENQVIVFTTWPGHSPREVEDHVTYPLSLLLQGIAGVRTVRGSSDVGYSMIHVIFEDFINVDAARRQLGDRLASAQSTLPAGVTPQLAPDAQATGQIFWYTVEGSGHHPARLRALQDFAIRTQLQAVAGVAEAASVGGFPLEYQVEVDPHRLRAHGVALDDLARAVGRANAVMGGHVLHKGAAEYLVRIDGQLGQASGQAPDVADHQRIVRELEGVPLKGRSGETVLLRDVATVSLGTGYRRGVFEKDGNEVTGGVVLMRRGENPLEVTRRIKEKLLEIRAGLPPGVHIVPCYDRTPLIEGAVGTVRMTVLEAMIVSIVCVLVVLLHLRASLIIVLTLPLAVGAPFVILWALRVLDVADVPINIMSLAGIAISVGVLVDASIVMTENAMHTLRGRFGDEPVRGDVRALVTHACQTVGRPLFFSVVIMLLSFVPVFALGGMEGKMFRPLALTKSLAMMAAAGLTITLVPALCTVLLRGRIRDDADSWLVRGMIQVYRPVLEYLLAHPGPLYWFMGVTLIAGAAPLGVSWIFLAAVFIGVVAAAWSARTIRGGLVASVTLIAIALVAEQHMKPLGREFITPLDEGMIMDMPITIPRASVTQAADDLKARDMILCRFPEVRMVVGKAGRAETPTDPAPLDMIETMVDFRPREHWPARRLDDADALAHGAFVVDAMLEKKLVTAPADDKARIEVAREAVTAITPMFQFFLRELAQQRVRAIEREIGHALLRWIVNQGIACGGQGRPLSDAEREKIMAALPHEHAVHLAMDPTLEDVTRLWQQATRQLERIGIVEPDETAMQVLRCKLTRWATGRDENASTRLYRGLLIEHDRLWREYVAGLDLELTKNAAGYFTRLTVDEFLTRLTATDQAMADLARERIQTRQNPPNSRTGSAGGHHHGGAGTEPTVVYRINPALEWFTRDLTYVMKDRITLRPVSREELIGIGGELDRSVRMPGWTNVWTMPIQNRVDMLATGVNTTIGVRVLGANLDDVVQTSEAIAAVLRTVRGAADVVADPIRGKGYVDVKVDRERAAAHGLNAKDVTEFVEMATGGTIVATTVEGRERHPVRVRLARAFREDDESLRQLTMARPRDRVQADCEHVPLTDVASITISEGPATIKSENGFLRNYVRLNVRGRDAAEFVAEAKQAVASRVTIPAGAHLEWTGQFEHEVHARDRLLVIVPLVIVVIGLLLFATYRDWADVLLVLMAVPGALAGGIFFQWLFGFKFSVTVWIGYIACFGMATSTGMIMLVYLRETVKDAGGLEKMSLEQIREAVLKGAVHRLRPKLLTEGTTILGLAPLLWATGVGSEVIKPMAAPVLGGLLIADEVIDLFLPVLFYRVRRARWGRLHPDSNPSP